MSRAAFLVPIILIILLFTMMMVPSTVHGSTINGLIFRANVNEMYIENQPVPVQVQALFFENSVPQSTSIIVDVAIVNLTSGQSYNSSFNVSSGVPQFIYLRSLPVGEYSFQAYASALSQSSQETSLEFLVAPPPVPYTASFVSGGLFSFHSNELYSTGHYNVNYTFTLNVYYQYPGEAAEEVSSYQNITNLTLRFPDDGQIVVVNVVDRFGWLNGMNINPSEGIFSGVPYSYDFNIVNQAPFTSIYAVNFMPDVIVVAVVTLIALSFYRRAKR